MKRLIVMLLVLAMVMAYIPPVTIFAETGNAAVAAVGTGEFAGGSGTVDDPYLISTKAHLNNVRNYLTSHFKMINDIEFTDADFAEGGDFYNNGTGWEPINDFSGTFDGDLYSITKLYINGAKYAGLFGTINDTSATIKNICLMDCDITGITYAGGICGEIANSTIYYHASSDIINCYVSGNIVATNGSAGGICGRYYNVHRNYNVEDYTYQTAFGQCFNAAFVSARIAGGIVGSSGVNTAYIRMEQCCNTGTINGSDSTHNFVAKEEVSYGSIRILGCSENPYSMACFQLQGTPEIVGNSTYLSNVTAGLSVSAAIRNTFQYKWYIDGVEVANKESYTLQAEDIGKKLKVEIISNHPLKAGTVYSEEVLVGKALQTEAPAIPELLYLDDNKFEISTVETQEYSIDNVNWQASGVFENLDPNKTYTVYSRILENDLYLTGESTEVLQVGTDRRPLRGSVSIVGTARFGDTLTADISALLPDGATFSYEWRSGDEVVGTDSTYTIVQSDIGKTIVLYVKGVDDYIGTLSSIGIVATKATVQLPNAPIVEDKTNTSITLVEKEGYEYSMDKVIWQDSPVFTGLSANTTYTFYQRVKETDTTFASKVSNGTTDTTLKNTVAAPEKPVVTKITNTSVTLKAIDGYEYSMDGLTWQTSNIFEGLDPYTEYSFCQRIAETKVDYASAQSSYTIVITLKNDIAAPAAPKVEKATETTVTLVDIDGYEYSLDGETWQSNNVFSGLTTLETYTFYQRVKETNTDYASAVSEGTVFKMKYVPEKPNAPVLVEKTNNKIVIEVQNGYEYSLGGTAWGPTGIFENLSPNATYQIYCRILETDTHYLSQNSDALVVTTLKNTAVKLDAPAVSATTSTSVTLVKVTGAEYSMDGVTWQSSNVFTGLSAITEYTFYQRMAETGTVYAGETSDVLTVRTPKHTPSTPNAPVLLSKTNTSITLVAVDGYEYSIDGVNWQDDTIFDNLKVYTTYYLYQRSKETADTYVSASSNALSVTTNKNSVAAPQAPGILERQQTSITLVYKAGYEYSMNGTTWQSSATFTGLSMNTSYTFYQRIKETSTSYASATSVATTVRTLSKMNNTAIPEKPVIQEVSTSSVTLYPMTGYEYSRNGSTWQSSNVFTGLSANTTYTFYQRIAATTDAYASSASVGTTATTTKVVSGTTAATNYDKLRQHISTYGTTNSNGNKNIIRAVNSNNYLFGFTLENVSNGIRFAFVSDSDQTSELVWVTEFVLTKNSKNITVEFLFLYNYMNSARDYAEVEKSIDRSTYNASNVYSTNTKGPFGYISSSMVQDNFNTTLEVMCAFWDEYIYENLGFGLKGLGFASYGGYGNSVCDTVAGTHCGSTETRNQRAAGCVVPGYTGDTYCTNCGEKIQTGSTTSSYGSHTYSNSCDSTCNRCSQSRDVPHSYSGDCDTTCNTCSAQRSATGIAHYYDLPTDVKCYVCGHQKLVTGISIASQPNKKVYAEGENLDLNGLVVKAKFDDGSSHAITGYAVSGYTTSAGTKTITISYGGYSATFTVMVNHVYDGNCDTTCNVCGAKRTTGTPHSYDDVKDMECNICQELRNLSRISVEKVPTKLVYAEGEALNLTGMVIKAHFDDGSSAEITDYTVTGDTSVAGKRMITIAYHQVSASFEITVNHVYPHACATICSMCGDKGTRDTKHTFDDVEDMICNICGEDKQIVRIAVEKQPDKTLYLEDEEFESAGLVIKVYYCDDSSKEITAYTLSGYTATPGTKTITVTYKGHTTTFEVLVKSRIPSTITSTVYDVQDGKISAINAGTTVETLLSGIVEGEFCTVHADGEPLAMDKLVGTGMIIKIMDGEETKIELVIVVAGDVNGDGKISVTDMLAVKAHLLDKEKLDGAHAQAADVTDDNKLSITDFIQVKAHLLGKEQISVAKAAPVMAQAIQEPAQSAEYVIVSVPVVEITTKEIAAPVSKEEIL